ncbi:hypothetical protein IW146_000475 [Coemansia sp. RSA 922]|nr:hypothetical protein GGH13_000787 [Coemansia sp. S155-1]KAJ2117776.1 hypothetical protein IW146_000475 [Coemansia sp. RSA 922]
MPSSLRVCEIQRRAFRVDVNKHGLSVPKQQEPPATIDWELRRRLQPNAPHLQSKVAAAAEKGAKAIDAVMHERQDWVAAKIKAQLSCPGSYWNNIHEDILVPLPSDAELAFLTNEWDEYTGPAVAYSGLLKACSALSLQRRPVIFFPEVVEHDRMNFSLGEGSSTVLGVGALTVSQVENAITSGVIEHMVAKMEKHADCNADVRFAWGMILGPGCVRICHIDHRSVYVSDLYKTTNDVGRRLLATMMSFVAYAEPWQLGSDPSMQWLDDIARWRIECPDSENKRPQVFYAQHTPHFIANSFFGRFTKCYLVSRSPTDRKPSYVLKDSWQEVPLNVADADLRDEIALLRGMSAALDDVWHDGHIVQLLVCGGTVLVDGTRDSTQFVLGAEPNDYHMQTATQGLTGDTQTCRLHRRMVTGPIGKPLLELRTQDAVLAVADAMLAYAAILERTGIVHSDISLGNIMAVPQADGRFRGMLIDFDLAIPQQEGVVRRRSHCVGTYPFQSIANLEFLKVPRTAVDDWEAVLALLLYLVTLPFDRDRLSERLSRVERDGSADVRRSLFSSPRAFSAAIEEFAHPQYVDEIKLIKDLYAATFDYSECPGTTRRKKGNELVDPIEVRAKCAVAIHWRCRDVMTRYLAPPPPESTESPVPQHPPHPPTSTTPAGMTPLTSSELGVKQNKRRPEALASLLVKRRKTAHATVGSSSHPAPDPATVPPRDLPGVSEGVVAQERAAHPTIDIPTARHRYSPEALEEVVAQGQAPPRPTKRKTPQEEPPVVPMRKTPQEDPPLVSMRKRRKT